MAVSALIVRLLFLVVPFTAHAGSARMSLMVTPGLAAEAEYWPGSVEKPAVMILHGFLQTRESFIVRHLAEALARHGYSVLTPSLTLGLNRRRQSLACEAIHLHSMQQDVDELRAWTVWLSERSGRPPILIGHSTGGVALAALLESSGSEQIEQAVLISPSYFGEELGVERQRRLMARVEEDLQRGGSELGAYVLGHCQRYVTSADRLLSYLAWDRARLDLVLSSGGIPLSVVYGEHDEQIDLAWLASLGDAGVSLRRVAAARHFFDLASEDDLSEEVLDVIVGDGHG